MTVQHGAAGGYRIRLSKEEPRSGHRPSVDVLFESLVPLKELRRHAVIMTGMGSDGARGMLALRRSGAVTTIAEAEQTCVVYGMPRAAVELEAASEVVNQHEIAHKLVQAVNAGT
jgi:two-component system chemotaxis response regulator CheB